MLAFVAVFMVIVAVLLRNWFHSNFSCHRAIITYLEENTNSEVGVFGFVNGYGIMVVWMKRKFS